MKYFIDFDRTVFDTDSFKRSLRERPTFWELLYEGKEAMDELFDAKGRKVRRRVFMKNIGTFASHGRFAFAAEELRDFMYPDAREFLRTHDCTIVTYGVRAFITAKVTTALVEHPHLEVIYTSRKKGRTIRKLVDAELQKGLEAPTAPEAAQKAFIFVDDMRFQLESVSRWCPEVEVIEIRRDGKKGHGIWRVIHSFDEL